MHDYFKRYQNMKTVLTFALTLISSATFGQQMTLGQWQEEALTNIRLLPKYGHTPKTDAQKEADKQFIEEAIKVDTTRRKASDHMIRLGFRYLYSDIKTSMYRFNQAYLLDSTNTDIYWGYGAVYMTLGEYDKAGKQYLEGLEINPQNTHLLTDYGTYFMNQYYLLQPSDERRATQNLDSAVSYMTKSYQLDSADQNTTFKLSVCYWIKGDCANALKYYDICKLHGGQPITESYTNALKNKCRPQNR